MHLESFIYSPQTRGPGFGLACPKRILPLEVLDFVLLLWNSGGKFVLFSLTEGTEHFSLTLSLSLAQAQVAALHSWILSSELSVWEFPLPHLLLWLMKQPRATRQAPKNALEPCFQPTASSAKVQSQSGGNYLAFRKWNLSKAEMLQTTIRQSHQSQEKQHDWVSLGAVGKGATWNCSALRRSRPPVRPPALAEPKTMSRGSEYGSLRSLGRQSMWDVQMEQQTPERTGEDLRGSVLSQTEAERKPSVKSYEEDQKAN